MHIVQISLKYPPIYSGYGNQLNTVNERIKKLNNKIFFTVLTGNYPCSREAKDLQISIQTLGPRVVFQRIEFLAVYFFAIYVFFWLLSNRNKIEVIHCVKAGPEAALAIIASKILKKPVIVKVAQDELRNLNMTSIGFKKMLRAMRYKTVAKADAFIAISNEIKNDIIRLNVHENLIHFIPNGVDETRFKLIESQAQKSKLRHKLKLQKDAKIVLFAGSIHPRKGIHDLLEAIKGIKVEKRSYVQFIFCGPDYGYADRIESGKTDLPSNIMIQYVGRVENLQEYMQAADIFILPSYSEGLPNVLLEAAMSGLCLLGSNIGGISDIINHGVNGFLFPVGDIESIRKTLFNVINDNESRQKMACQAKNIAMEKYTLQSIAISYIDLYFKLAKGANNDR